MLQKWISIFQSENLWLSGAADSTLPAIEQIISDSRMLAEKSQQNLPEKSQQNLKSVFFARRGATRDGHDFLPELSKASSIVAFVVERIPENFKPEVPVIVVRDSTAAMALAVKIFYGDPTASALTVAVTGTNGKTTTTFLVQALLKALGKRPARTGTIETQFESYQVPANLTTPDFTEIQKSFSDLKNRGASAFVFEASSHALDQRRLLGLELDAALFTNLTPEHLDYHQTMENYFVAKKKLFSDLLQKSHKKNKIAIFPEDGSYGSQLIHDFKNQSGFSTVTWGFENKPDLKIDSWKTSLEGSELKVSGLGLKGVDFRSKLIGQYNIENIAGMLALGLSLKATPQQLQRALDEVPAIPGRLEPVKIPSDGFVFVDYAHTPDALENVVTTLRPLTKGQLKVVFGCGGDRDPYKRPQMGAIVELYADELFVTSDNPRTEEPDLIIQQILKGLQRLKPVTVEVDRRKAIAKAVKNLKKGDVVLIAGKGHENYQILGTTKVHFDDREVALECFSN